jgi:hypothetical protein
MMMMKRDFAYLVDFCLSRERVREIYCT